MVTGFLQESVSRKAPATQVTHKYNLHCSVHPYPTNGPHLQCQGLKT